MVQHNSSDSNILIRYVLGGCKKEEQQEVLRWINESNQNKKTLNHLRLVLKEI